MSLPLVAPDVIATPHPFAPHPLDPRGCSPRELFERGARTGFAERELRRWLGAVVGRGETTHAAWAARGVLNRQARAAIGDLTRLSVERIDTSPTDGFQKLVLRCPDGAAIETVVIPLHKPNAATVCLSSQVGCVMGCAFCATTRMPRRRNLATWEIVDQFLHAREAAAHAGRRITGAVFMGMGEPFLNYTAVIAAAEVLSFPVENAVGAPAITVSTVGLVDEITRFTDEAQPFRLSISLGAATDEKRRALLPVASRFPVAEVMAAARRHALARRTRINIAYVCIGGVNVSPDDAQALGELVGDTPVRLDLIDVFDPSGRFTPPTPPELATFRDALRRYVGQPVARRYSGGKDIRAACGTLAAGA